MDKLLSSVYYDPNSPACYAGIQAVYREAKKQNPKLKQKDVVDFLHKQRTYTLHKPIVRKFKHHKIVANGIDTHWQADLADMKSLAKYNEGYKYLLVCYDVLSKYAWVQPLKDKRPETLIKAMGTIFKEGRKPWWLMTDKGKEFVAKEFQRFMTKNFIIHYVSQSPDVKAANAERYIKTLKNRLWKHFTRKNSFRYINVLQKIVQAINSSYNTALGCRPIDVTKENEAEVKEKLYGPKKTPLSSKFTYNIGDNVRIAVQKTAFKRGYQPNFTKEIFTVMDRVPGLPTPVYRLKDQQGNEIDGKFYPKELVKAVE